MNKISFVLPLKIHANKFGSDLERVSKVLLPSILKNFDIGRIEKFLVIVPENEQAEVAEKLKEFAAPLTLSVLPEEELLATVPGWKTHLLAFRLLWRFKNIDTAHNEGKFFRYLKLADGWNNLNGWRRQQLLKLLAARMVSTPYYMTLDSDLCLTCPADMTTLLPEGKALVELEPAYEHPEWWMGSAEILDTPFVYQKDEAVMGVTPELLSTRVAVQLIDHLASVARKRGYLTLFEYLSTNRQWTEYSLYWLFLSEFYEKNDFYAEENGTYSMHSPHNVWEREQAPDAKELCKRIDAAFKEKTALFLVIQSARIPLAEYLEAINKHIQLNALQPE